MIRISTIIIAVLFALSAAYSVWSFIDPSVILDGDFRAVTGKDYREVLGDDAVFVSSLHIRHMNVFEITSEIAGFFILFAGFRKGAKWAWAALLVAGVLCWGFGVAVNLVIGNMFDFT